MEAGREHFLHEYIDNVNGIKSRQLPPLKIKAFSIKKNGSRSFLLKFLYNIPFIQNFILCSGKT